MQETEVQTLGGKTPQRMERPPLPVFLPGESHEQEPGGLPSMGL